MRLGPKYVALLFLSAALMAPVGALALPVPQDDHEKHEQEGRERKVYDSVHKDYHNWDAREDQAYHRWLETKHESYVDYDRLDHKRQDEYWKWRHKHADHEDNEHH